MALVSFSCDCGWISPCIVIWFNDYLENGELALHDDVLLVLETVFYFQFMVPENHGLEYVSIHSDVLRRSNSDYRTAVDLLKKQGVLLMDEQFIYGTGKDNKTKGYAIAPAYRLKPGEIPVKYPFRQFKHRCKNSTNKTANGQTVDYFYLQKWLTGSTLARLPYPFYCLTIDKQNAEQALKAIYQEKCQRTENAIARLKDNFFASDDFNSFQQCYRKTLASNYPYYAFKHPLAQILFKLEELYPQRRSTEALRAIEQTWQKVHDFLQRCNEDFRTQQHIVIEQIASNTLRYNVDKTGFRLHTTIVRMKKELRPFLRFRHKDSTTQELISIDLKNSQPFLAIALLEKRFFTLLEGSSSKQYFLSHPRFASFLAVIQEQTTSQELKELKQALANSDVLQFREDVLSGKFYERMAVHAGWCTRVEEVTSQQRSDMKESMFLVLFSSEDYHHQLKKAFEKIYPTVSRIFNFIKRGDKCRLSVLLQRVESYLVLEVVCGRIAKDNKNIPLYTIHDSIATLPQYKKAVIRAIKQEFRRLIKVVPQLSVERWSPPKEG